MCKALGERLRIPVITGMHRENPGVELYRRYAYICKTGTSARDMIASINSMTHLAFKLVSGEKGTHLVTRENLPRPAEFNYFPRLIIRNEYVDAVTAERTIDKLLSKARGEPFESEVEPPKFKKVPPPEPIKNLATSEIAIVSDGGLVPKGNPDGISSRGNLRWASYQIDNFLPEDFKCADYEVAHTGYFSVDVLEDPNRLVPADALRDLIKEGKVGKLHPRFFSTSGNATVALRCAEMGKEIGREIKRQGVNGVLLTST
jgi:glycine reductase